MAKRNLYLNNTPMEEAKAQYLAALRPLIKPRTETIDTAGALGRVTAAAVYARCCSPLFNAAAMDFADNTIVLGGLCRRNSDQDAKGYIVKITAP